jgi:cobyrinic acid a,c-diamide synthase
MHQYVIDFPRIFIAGLRGGTGKTILSIGIIGAWKRQGKSVAPYKKGPDYIDAGWLALAAGRPCYNLDTFLTTPEDVIYSFSTRTLKQDIAVIEGNRGLYDGIDTQGSTCSAEIAKLLKTPVILCLDCTKSTRTMAAVVCGCMGFDPEVDIKGIILNRVAGSRHEQILRKSIEYHCKMPVVGAVPRLSEQNFPERHMGLVPTPEHILSRKSVEAAADIAERYLDLDALEKIARAAPDQSFPMAYITPRPIPGLGTDKPRIGVIKDSAFQFYYPDNIEALEGAGGEVVFISACQDKNLPPIDALYIGGGFPETHAEQLSENKNFMDQLKAGVEQGLPVYAECGGLMYLGESLVVDGNAYPMTGILPAVFGLSRKPQGLGYTIVSVRKKNPYFKPGMEIKGHEFRYSEVLEWKGHDEDLIFEMRRGTGFIRNLDGITRKNVLATYTHIHALGVPEWASALVANALDYKSKK